MFDSSLFGKRLKELRESSGISHRKLSEALQKKYGIDISTNSLMNYEVTEKNHTKYGKNTGMRTEYLYYFSDFYNVSADYLLGFTDEPSKKQTAVDELNLPPSVISYLLKINSENEVYRDTFIAILNNPTFWEGFIPSIYGYINASVAELLSMDISYECQYRKHNGDFEEVEKELTIEDLEASYDEEQAETLRLYESGKIDHEIYEQLLAINAFHGNIFLSSSIPYRRNLIPDAHKLRITSQLERILNDIEEIESEKAESRIEEDLEYIEGLKHGKY